MKTCEICNEKTYKKINEAFDKFLCCKCCQLPEYQMICKTMAIKQYFLSEDDLDNLDSFEKVNPRRKSTKMTLYREIDIRQQACIKHNCFITTLDEKLVDLTTTSNYKKQQRLMKKELKQNEREMKKEWKQNERQTNLVNALENAGLELRSDSKLCHGYINGNIKDKTIDEIVERMCQVKYLFDYCNFQKILDDVHDSQIEEYNAGYFPDCPVFDEAEGIVLHKIKKYPAIYPWMNIENK